jgi:predicted TIM-barrel fold metal-dependent hydrolase
MTEETSLPTGTVHGGRGALKRVQQGKEFVGLAKIAQDEVTDRLEAEGIEGELRRDAERLQVVSDLYYNALIKALQDGELDRATEYLSKWGWITNSAVRSWQVAMKLQPKDKAGDVTKILETYRGKPDTSPQEGKNGTNNSVC